MGCKVKNKKYYGALLMFVQELINYDPPRDVNSQMLMSRDYKMIIFTPVCCVIYDNF
jgi:hypothetical protein